jgi:glycosyltransferase involved in cell wall biosynthesis
MRIALVINKLTGGGAERVAAMWAEGFCQRGHNVSVILTDNKSPKTYILPQNVNLFSVDVSTSNRALSKIKERIVTPFLMRKVFKEWQPDVVISVLPWWMRNIKLASIGMRHKIISTDHNSFQRPEDAKMSFRMHLKKYYFQGWADAITVLTQADKDYIGNRLKNVYVLPNPLAFNCVKDVPPKQNVILAVGRLDAWHYKGFDILIDAWGSIFRNFPDWELHIMGAGSSKDVEFLENIAFKYAIGKQLKFVPYQVNPKDIFKDSAIFVLSSRYEGFGLVLIEAMSQGCACVACDYYGRQRDIICDDKYGIICPPADKNALASAIERMIKDEDYRLETQTNAPQRASAYNLENIMNKWDVIIKNVME